MKNSVELRKEKEELKSRCISLVESAKKEERTLSDDETTEINASKERIFEIDGELRSIEAQLKTYDNLIDFSAKKEMKEERNVKVTAPEERVSLLGMIDKVVNNRSFTEAEENLINRGKALNAAQGQNKIGSGQIQIPLEERAAFTVGTDHNDMVATDLQTILDPLRAQNVLAKAGAKFLTGLRGDIQYPVLTAASVGWVAENGTAADGAGTISSKTISPKRLSAYIDISKQFLVQDSASCEQAIMRDLVNAINDKLEATILGNESDDPAHFSLFYNQTPTSISTYAGLCGLEATVEDANIFGKMSYLVSPGAKATLRSMAKSTKVTQLVLEGGDIDGTPVYSSTNVGKGVGSGTPFVQSGNLIYGDFTNLVIGQWGGLDLVIDPYTQARDNKIRVVVNALFGVGVLRPQAFAFGLV